MVRIHAGQPTQILSNRRTAREIRRNRSNLHWRTEAHEKAPKRSLFVNYSSKVFGAIDEFRTFSKCWWIWNSSGEFTRSEPSIKLSDVLRHDVSPIRN